jgi:hypothetical protein
VGSFDHSGKHADALGSTGARPYQCSVVSCQKTFCRCVSSSIPGKADRHASKITLTKHTKRHHSNTKSVYTGQSSMDRRRRARAVTESEEEEEIGEQEEPEESKPAIQDTSEPVVGLGISMPDEDMEQDYMHTPWPMSRSGSAMSNHSAFSAPSAMQDQNSLHQPSLQYSRSPLLSPLHLTPALSEASPCGSSTASLAESSYAYTPEDRHHHFLPPLNLHRSNNDSFNMPFLPKRQYSESDPCLAPRIADMDRFDGFGSPLNGFDLPVPSPVRSPGPPQLSLTSLRRHGHTLTTSRSGCTRPPALDTHTACGPAHSPGNPCRPLSHRLRLASSIAGAAPALAACHTHPNAFTPSMSLSSGACRA